MAYRGRYILAGLAATLFFTISCGGSSDWDDLNIPQYPQTWIVPQTGDYPIYTDDGTLMDVFVVEEESGQLFMRYIHYRNVIKNGAFEVIWGQIGGTHCPTDGFYLRGHFLTPTEAEGVLLREFACQVVKKIYFRTQLAN